MFGCNSLSQLTVPVWLCYAELIEQVGTCVAASPVCFRARHPPRSPRPARRFTQEQMHARVGEVSNRLGEAKRSNRPV